MASADTISMSPARRASSSASADFPDAVGPTIASDAGTVWLAGGDGNAGAVRRSGSDLDQLAGEVVRSRPRDARHGEGAGRDRVDAAEVHELVLPSAAGEDVGVLAAAPLDDHLFEATDASLVLCQRAALDDDAQPLEAFGDDV